MNVRESSKRLLTKTFLLLVLVSAPYEPECKQPLMCTPRLTQPHPDIPVVTRCATKQSHIELTFRAFNYHKSKNII